MKKIIALGLLLAFQNSNAQTVDHSICLFPKKSVSIGAGAALGLNENVIGFNGRILYQITDKITIGPDVSYLQMSNSTILSVNIAGRYVIPTSVIGIYPITGVNYTTKLGAIQGESAAGLVLGGGINRNFNHFGLFSEFSYITSKIGEPSVSFGLIYSFH